MTVAPEPDAETVRTLTAREREEVVIAVKLRGGTFLEAAQEAGYSDRGTAYAAWKRALERLPTMDGKTLRTVILDRHEAAFALAWGIAQDTENKPMVRLAALDRCRAAMAESAKLAGVYAPVEQRVTVVSEDSVDAAIAQLLAEFPEVDPERAGTQEDAPEVPPVPASVA